MIANSFFPLSQKTQIEQKNSISTWAGRKTVFVDKMARKLKANPFTWKGFAFIYPRGRGGAVYRLVWMAVASMVSEVVMALELA